MVYTKYRQNQIEKNGDKMETKDRATWLFRNSI